MTLPEGSEKCREDIDSSPESTPAKKIKLEEKGIIKPITYHQKGVSLLDLSDDVLLMICYFLKPIDLLALSQCCTRLEEVVSDRTLWVNVDFRPTPLQEVELKKYLKFFLPSTKSIATCGFKNATCGFPNGSLIYIVSEETTPSSGPTMAVISLTSNFIQNLCEAAPNLKEFIAENQFIDGSELLLEHFPPSLEYLSFKNSDIFAISRCKSYFSGFDQVLPNVEVLDLRRTMISDRELGCLNSNVTLRELYLEAPEVLGGEIKVTDMGVTMFGNVTEIAQNRVNYPNVVILYMIGNIEKLGTPSPLRKILVRNYTLVTDTTLKHAAVCLINLTYIDVTGTGCSQEGVITFKRKRPNVTIISDYDIVSK